MQEKMLGVCLPHAGMRDAARHMQQCVHTLVSQAGRLISLLQEQSFRSCGAIASHKSMDYTYYATVWDYISSSTLLDLLSLE